MFQLIYISFLIPLMAKLIFSCHLYWTILTKYNIYISCLRGSGWSSHELGATFNNDKFHKRKLCLFGPDCLLTPYFLCITSETNIPGIWYICLRFHFCPPCFDRIDTTLDSYFCVRGCQNILSKLPSWVLWSLFLLMELSDAPQNRSF